MNYAEWIGAGIIAAILLFLFRCVRYVMWRSNLLSHFLMTLLLDEFSYRRYRKEFIELIESHRVEERFLLYNTAMMELEDIVEKDAAKHQISNRMWLLNQEAILTGRSATDTLQNGREPFAGATGLDADDKKPAGFFQPSKLPDTLRPAHEERYPNRELYITWARRHLRMRRAYLRFRRRMHNALGMR